MKNFLIILCLIFLTLPVFAEYKPIPPERSAEYKAEIEQYIKTDTSYYKKQMDEEINKAKKTYFSYYHNKKNKNIYIEKLETSIRNIDTIEFDYYRQIVIITLKYVNIQDDLPQTDWVGDYINLLSPYLKDNHIDNTNEIDSVSFYAYDRNKEIEKMMEIINNTNF